MINEQKLRKALAGNMLCLHLLKKPRISQQALARFIGTTQKSISRYECGEAMPPLCILVAIAGYYGCTVDELLQEKKPEKTMPTQRSMTERNITERNMAKRETAEKKIA